MFSVLLGGYFAVTLFYSLKLKQVPILDVMTLASLYTWRIFAGAVAISVVVSTWLMAFSVFLFLSLALIKRCSELLINMNSGNTTVSGRGYMTSDINLLCSLGAACGVASVLVLALYISSPVVVDTYYYNYLLWAICPLLLYWISYCWMLTARGEMHDDPVLFATKDKTSYIISGLIVLTWFLARGGIF
jgi:4-hydroxybenzoate polyprenyltransferase